LSAHKNNYVKHLNFLTVLAAKYFNILAISLNVLYNNFHNSNKNIFRSVSS